MKRPTAADQLLKIKSYEKGYVALMLIRTGMELGLFAAIGDRAEGVTAAQLARELDLHEPYLYVWCTTAYHFELLDCVEGDRFVLQPGLDEVLVNRHSPRCYRGNVKLTVDCLSRDMAEFARYMRTGEVYPYREHDPSLSKTIAESTSNLYAVVKGLVIPGVPGMEEEMERGADILEVGCGGGELMIRLAGLYPNCTFTGVDVDRFGIEEAQRSIREKGLGSRVAAELMGGEDVPHNERFDYALMMLTLHEVRREARRGVLANCLKALKRGGRLVIVDFPYPACVEEFRETDYERGIFDQYREMIMDHHILTRSEQEELVAEAGFSELDRFKVGRGMFDVLVAAKGEA